MIQKLLCRACGAFLAERLRHLKNSVGIVRRERLADYAASLRDDLRGK
jgi:hypothetical protein